MSLILLDPIFPQPFIHVEYQSTNVSTEGNDYFTCDLTLFLPCNNYDSRLATPYLAPFVNLLGKPLDSNWGSVVLEYDLSKLPNNLRNNKYRFICREIRGSSWQVVLKQEKHLKGEIISIMKDVTKPSNYTEILYTND